MQVLHDNEPDGSQHPCRICQTAMEHSDEGAHNVGAAASGFRRRTASWLLLTRIDIGRRPEWAQESSESSAVCNAARRKES